MPPCYSCRGERDLSPSVKRLYPLQSRPLQSRPESPPKRTPATTADSSDHRDRPHPGHPDHCPGASDLGGSASDVVALLVVGALAVTGLAAPEAAIAGFSNPAVITVGDVHPERRAHARAGISGLLGSRVTGIAGRNELPLIISTIMLISVAVGVHEQHRRGRPDAARRDRDLATHRRAVSRLLMPMLSVPCSAA